MSYEKADLSYAKNLRKSGHIYKRRGKMASLFEQECANMQPSTSIDTIEPDDLVDPLSVYGDGEYEIEALDEAMDLKQIAGPEFIDDDDATDEFKVEICERNESDFPDTSAERVEDSVYPEKRPRFEGNALLSKTIPEPVQSNASKKTPVAVAKNAPTFSSVQCVGKPYTIQPLKVAQQNDGYAAKAPMKVRVIPTEMLRQPSNPTKVTTDNNVEVSIDPLGMFPEKPRKRPWPEAPSVTIKAITDSSEQKPVLLKVVPMNSLNGTQINLVKTVIQNAPTTERSGIQQNPATSQSGTQQLATSQSRSMTGQLKNNITLTQPKFAAQSTTQVSSAIGENANNVARWLKVSPSIKVTRIPASAANDRFATQNDPLGDPLEKCSETPNASKKEHAGAQATNQSNVISSKFPEGIGGLNTSQIIARLVSNKQEVRKPPTTNATSENSTVNVEEQDPLATSSDTPTIAQPLAVKSTIPANTQNQSLSAVTTVVANDSTSECSADSADDFDDPLSTYGQASLTTVEPTSSGRNSAEAVASKQSHFPHTASAYPAKVNNPASTQNPQVTRVYDTVCDCKEVAARRIKLLDERTKLMEDYMQQLIELVHPQYKFELNKLNSREDLERLNYEMGSSPSYLLKVRQWLERTVRATDSNERMNEAMKLMFHTEFFPKCSWKHPSKIPLHGYTYITQLFKHIGSTDGTNVTDITVANFFIRHFNTFHQQKQQKTAETSDSVTTAADLK